MNPKKLAAEMLRAPEIEGVSPLEKMLSIMRRKGQRPELALAAAAHAAPYIHPRQPQAIHVSGGVKIEHVTVEIIGLAGGEAPPALPPGDE